MMNEFLPLIAVTVTILVANWTMIRGLRAEMREEIQALRTEMKEIQLAQHGFNERMAGLEGLVTGLKEAIVARSAA